jgi:deoxycytidylate deaminase
MTKKEIAYFEAAKAVSKLSDHNQKMGCVIVNKHRIISSGFNSETKCHRIQAQLDMNYYRMHSSGKIHAETSALLPLRHLDLSKASVFIYRELKDGTKALARPCPCCQKLIKQLGIRHVYYTGNDSLVYEEFI